MKIELASALCDVGLSASLVQACSLGRYRREFKSLQPHHLLFFVNWVFAGVWFSFEVRCVLFYAFKLRVAVWFALPRLCWFRDLGFSVL